MSDEKSKYIIAYGSSNADSYGRGDVTDVSTKYNMLTTNPLLDKSAPEMNSYSPDGSYNQDIFGWKCFNGPVSFRNGIYGEGGFLSYITSEDFERLQDINFGFIYTDNACGLSLSSYYDNESRSSITLYTMRDLGNNPTSQILLRADDIYCTGKFQSTVVAANNLRSFGSKPGNSMTLLKAHSKGDIDQYNLPASQTKNYVEIFGHLIKKAPAGDWDPPIEVDLGAPNVPFNNIYADNIISRMQLFKSSDSFELYDIRPLHIKLHIELNSMTPSLTVSIKDRDEFFVDNQYSISSFGNIDVSMPLIREISIGGNEAIRRSYFMVPSLSSNTISLSDADSTVDLTNKKFMCVSKASSTGTPDEYAGGTGAGLDLDFYIIVMRIE